MRVATWNILHGLDFRRGGVDLAAVGRAVDNLAADVVALQEVDVGAPRSGTVDQAAELSRLTGMHSVFAPSLCGDIATSWVRASGPVARGCAGPAYGLALLTRHPLRRWRRIHLPGGGDHDRRRAPHSTRPGWDHEPRVALQVELHVEGAAVQITTTHLSYLPWRSVRQLTSVLRAQGDGGSAVILGDFNLPPVVVNARARGWTPAGGAATHPAPEPRLQLDQILVRGLDVRAVQVAPASTSDHLALVAELGLRLRN